MSNNTGYQDSADFTRTNNINGIVSLYRKSTVKVTSFRTLFIP